MTNGQVRQAKFIQPLVKRSGTMADVGAHSSAGVSQTMARTINKKVNSNQVKFENGSNNNYHFNLNKVHKVDKEIQ